MVSGDEIFLAKPVDIGELRKRWRNTSAGDSAMKPPKPSKTASSHAHSTNRPGQLASLREPAAQPSPGSSRPGKRILLVDDDPTVRDSLNDVLVAEGYVVIPAENGQQALDLANQLPVDLVLCST